MLLGGATLWDVFQVYLFFAIDGLLFAAIGLFFSCTARNSLEALAWTYFTLFLLVFFSSFSAIFLIAPSGSGIAAGGNPMFAVAALNPFVAVEIGGRGFDLFGLHLPAFVGSAILAFLLIRMLITCATLRMGRFGQYIMTSMRRQILLLTSLVSVVLFFSVAGTMLGTRTALIPLSLFIMIFLGTAFFLPALFAPTVADDAEPGIVITGAYKPLAMFRAVHAGALPFFHIWLLTYALSAVAGVLLQLNLSGGGTSFATSVPISPGSVSAPGAGVPMNNETVLSYFAMATFYLSGLGFMVWGMARRSATVVVGSSAVRALTFGLSIIIVCLPLMIAATTGWGDGESSIWYIWLLYPLTKLFSPGGEESLLLLFIYGLVGYGNRYTVLSAMAFGDTGDAKVRSSEKRDARTVCGQCARYLGRC